MLRPGKHWYLPAAFAVGAFVGGPLLVQVRLLEPIQGFLLFALSGLLGAFAILWGLRLMGLRETRKALILVVAGLLPLGALGAGLLSGRNVPRINDISTDLDNPPRFTARTDAPYPDEFKEMVRTGYPDLISKNVALPPPRAFEQVVKTAKSLSDWDIVRVDAAALTVEGTQTSTLFRFVDDFIIRVEPLGADSLIAMRSRSRDGKGDFGVNAARVRRFFAALDGGNFSLQEKETSLP